MRHPNSFTTRHPSPILLWKDWSGSLSIDYLPSSESSKHPVILGDVTNPKTILIYIYRLYHRHLLYICPTISRPKNTDESSPTSPWDITTHRPHFGARGQSCLPNLRGKQVSFLHDQYRRFTSHRIHGTGIYLPTWMVDLLWFSGK